ncbi:RNA polymerase sigma factor [Nocardia aurantiaca]|uniref:Sigma-70 family RNA polymerase sigma factor n=1 Tax=Nocardia aurantiaca TaxID=2675850 RepID=A0A6I3KYL1_9NOCA|nr:sigma-70 family RNA polymerase sigma factor [Nocardia aurantiaca]MTE13294.1 sigma-70 family RNA polymerase sigma factor [Nocardia aurantiaca]
MPDTAIEDLLRDLAPQVLGVLIRRYGDFDAAEDALQEAMLMAATHWPVDGLPDNPRGWLISVGQRRLIDAIRADAARRNREAVNAIRDPERLCAAAPDPADAVIAALTDADLPSLASPPDRPNSATGGTRCATAGNSGRADSVQPNRSDAGASPSGSDHPRPAAATTGRSGPAGLGGTDPDAEERDDTLTLFFLCCHPALSPASAIALTLRAVGGLTTEEIARAFLVPEKTMAQRITRAKKRLAAEERPFTMPMESLGQRGEWNDRLDSVLRVLYLIYTEGHTSGGERLHRVDLSNEAIRLARALYRVLPDNPEVTGLLALLLLTDARRAARTGTRGELIPLAEQDRGLWDRELIIEGVRLATASVRSGLIGPYQIQAAIAALHSQALRPEDTDWPRILLLYNALERESPNPMVTLNRAVATAMVHGPQAGLDLTDTLDESLAGNHRLPAVRGHLHEMAGDYEEAIAHYTAAAQLTTSLPERNYLILRAARLRRA